MLNITGRPSKEGVITDLRSLHLNNICSKGGRLTQEKISQLRKLAENDLLYSDSGSLKGTEMVQLTLLWTTLASSP